MCKFQAVEVHMHHKYATSQDFFPPIYDVVLADYDISPSCRFSHATAQLYLISCFKIFLSLEAHKAHVYAWFH